MNTTQTHMDLVSVSLTLAANLAVSFSISFAEALFVEPRAADPGDGSQLPIGGYFDSDATVKSFVASAGQTVFNSPTPASFYWKAAGTNLVVKKNGTTLTGGGTDYTVTDADTITLTSAASAGDVIELTVRLIIGNGSKLIQIGRDFRTVHGNKISVALATALDRWFNKGGPTARVLLVDTANVSTSGADSCTTIFASLEPVYNTYFGVFPTTNLTTVIADCAVGITSASVYGDHMVFASTNLLGKSSHVGGISTAFVTTASGALTEAQRDRTLVCYHDACDATPTEAPAVDFMATKLQKVATKSVSANGLAQSTAPLAPITETEKTNLRANNFNFALPVQGYPSYVDPGKTLSGRPIYQMLDAFLIKNRLITEIAQAKGKLASTDDKWPITRRGVAKLDSILLSNYRRASSESEGRLLTEQDEKDAVASGRIPRLSIRQTETPTAGDIAAEQLRATFEGYHAVDARRFSINLVLDQ